MRILADENVAMDIVAALRPVGHDVIWAWTDMPGDGDDRLLERAIRERRILLTNDVDFATAAASPKNATSIGVILMRFCRGRPAAIAEAVVEALGSRDDWAGKLAVMGFGSIRIRQF